MGLDGEVVIERKIPNIGDPDMLKSMAGVPNVSKLPFVRILPVGFQAECSGILEMSSYSGFLSSSFRPDTGLDQIQTSMLREAHQRFPSYVAVQLVLGAYVPAGDP